MTQGRIVRIKGIKQYKDRHGKIRRYHRATSTPLDPSLEGVALAVEIERLDKIVASRKAKPGTIKSLIIDYQRRSGHWKSLRERTQKDYERVFSYLSKINALDERLIDITVPDIAAARDFAASQHEPKFANQLVTTLSKVFAHGVERGFMDKNPAIGVTKARGGKKRPNRPYAAEELATLILNAPSQLLGPIYFASIYGLREGDILTLSRKDISGDWLAPTTSKSKRPIRLFLTNKAKEIISQQDNENATTIFVNSRYAPWTIDGFRSSWAKYRDDLSNSGLIDEGGTFHGFRHSVATLLAEGGYEETDYKHLLGHGPKTMSGHYSRSARRDELVKEMILYLDNLLIEATNEGQLHKIY